MTVTHHHSEKRIFIKKLEKKNSREQKTYLKNSKNDTKKNHLTLCSVAVLYGRRMKRINKPVCKKSFHFY